MFASARLMEFVIRMLLIAAALFNALRGFYPSPRCNEITTRIS